MMLKARIKMCLMAHVTLFLITFDLVEIFKEKKVNTSVGLDLRVGMFQNSREGSVSAKMLVLDTPTYLTTVSDDDTSPQSLTSVLYPGQTVKLSSLDVRPYKAQRIRRRVPVKRTSVWSVYYHNVYLLDFIIIQRIW